MLLLLFRIVYACLSGLPMESLNAGSIASAIIPYFCDERKDVQIAAINAGQFLIPAIWNSKPVRQQFILREDSVCSLLYAFGNTMPIISSLKLLYSFSLLPENCSLFIRKGIALLSTSVMVLSSRQIEKELAFHLLKNLIQGHVSATESLDKYTVSSQQETSSEVEIKDNKLEFDDGIEVLSDKSSRLCIHTSPPEPDRESIEDLLLHFANCFKQIKNIVTCMDISTSEPFTNLKRLMDDLEERVTDIHLSHSVNHRLNNLLLEAIADLLQGISHAWHVAPYDNTRLSIK